MQLILPPTQAWPLLSTAQCRALEALAAQTAEPAPMERAGLAIAKLALALQPHARRIAIVCGPGNNGGDGLVAARWLHTQGREVSVSLLAGARTPPDAANALRAAQQAGVPVHPGLADLSAADLLIDALLGLGLSRAPSGPLLEAIYRINAQTAPVLAVDLPSGLDADTGHAFDGVRACDTLSLLALKPGLFTGRGREASGRIWFDDLGVLPPHESVAHLIAAHATRTTAPDHASHKGSRGDVIVLGGATGMHGAARLAARAALAAGAGRVYLSLLDANAQDDPGRPELMAWSDTHWQDPPLWRGKIIVAGCGGGQAIAAALPPLLRHAERLLLDADALNAIAADASLQTLLEARQGLPTLLTPHPLEAARLLGHANASAVQADRLAAADALVKRYACAVVLKGSGTLVCAPAARPGINGTGNSALATAGTGDVLAGWTGGLWAQSPGSAPGTVAQAAVALHGTAADELAAQGISAPLRAADLIERMWGCTAVRSARAL